jgi:preprotein translocase subunit SecF
MKNIKKNFIGSVLAIMTLIISLACSQYGTKLEFNGGELYYTENITETEAKKFGEYLVKEEIFDGQEKSVQLDKSGSTYQFRMVVKPELQNDESYAGKVKVFGSQLSADFFNDAPLEVHLCDDSLKTVRVVKP